MSDAVLTGWLTAVIGKHAHTHTRLLTERRGRFDEPLWLRWWCRRDAGLLSGDGGGGSVAMVGVGVSLVTAVVVIDGAMRVVLMVSVCDAGDCALRFLWCASPTGLSSSRSRSGTSRAAP